MSYFENLGSITPSLTDGNYSVKSVSHPMKYTTESVEGFSKVDYERSLSTEM
jgi:hypothetical protein